jgi:hypothetical protein
MVKTSVEGDLFGAAILSYLNSPGDAFAGTATQLLEKLEDHVGYDVLSKPNYRKFWPQSARAAGNALKRLSPFLRRMGFEYEYNPAGNTRDHYIRRK